MSDKKIPTLDTLFGGCNTETKENNKIEMLETDTLFPYSEHPFLVKDNDDLKELIQSIKDEGILIPLLVRVHSHKHNSESMGECEKPTYRNTALPCIVICFYLKISILICSK